MRRVHAAHAGIGTAVSRRLHWFTTKVARQSQTERSLTGGLKVRPGEVSLAHLGVLFLDELPEFHGMVELLHQNILLNDNRF